MSSPTPDFPDWSTPVQSVDQVLKYTPPGQTIAAGGFLGSFNTAQMSSVIVSLGLIAGSGAEQMMLALEWTEGNASASVDYMTYADAPAYGGAFNLLQWQVPVRGSSLIVRARGTNATPQGITVLGSTRTIAQASLVPRVTGAGGGVGNLTGRFLLDTGAVSVNAGATSARFYIPPVARRIAVRCNQPNPVSVQLDGIDYFAGAMSRFPFQYLMSPAVVVPLAVELDCPGQGLELTIFNGDTGAHSCHAYVWDVS